MGPGGQLHRPPPTPWRWRPGWQHRPRRRSPGPRAYEQRYFRDIARTDGVPGTARLPPHPHCAARERDKEEGQAARWRRHQPPPPFTPHTFAPTGGHGGAAGARRKHGCTGAGRSRATGAWQQRPLATLATAGTAGGDEESGAAAPHAKLVRRTQGPRVQVMQGAAGCAALLL